MSEFIWRKTEICEYDIVIIVQNSNFCNNKINFSVSTMWNTSMHNNFKSCFLPSSR